MSFLSRTIILIAFCFSFEVCATEEHLLKLDTGLLEGVNEADFTYKLIEVNDTGKHRFFSLRIVSAFKKGRFREFTDKDITCTNVKCTISILEEKEQIYLALYPVAGGYKIVETYLNNAGKYILSHTYDVVPQKKKSTVREFVEKYKSSIDRLSSLKSYGIYGFWLGVLSFDDRRELISFEINENSKSHFVRFLNGENSSMNIDFYPENIIRKNDYIEITTENKVFANKLIIHDTESVLEGYFYSVHKGVTLQKGTFKLYRME